MPGKRLLQSVHEAVEKPRLLQYAKLAKGGFIRKSDLASHGGVRKKHSGI